MNLKNFKLTNYPESVFIGAWVLAFFMYATFFGAVSLEVFLYFSVFSICLAAGAGLCSVIKITSKVQYYSSASTLAFIVIALVLVDALYAIQVIYFTLGSNSVASALSEIRQSTLNGDSVIENISLFVNANQFLFGLSLFGYVELQHKIKCSIKTSDNTLGGKFSKYHYLFIFGILTSLVISVLDGSRSFFLSILLTLVFMLYQLAIIKLRQIILVLISFLFLFAATFSVFRTDANSETFSEGLKYTAAYFSGGIGSLDYVIRGEIKVYWRDLEALENKLESIGLPFDKYDLQSLKMDYVDIGDGIQTNVYTALGVYYEYMGYASLLFAFVMGGFIRYICKLSRSSLWGLYCYSFYLTALILSVFHDYFLSVSYFLLKILLILFGIRMLEHFFKTNIMQRSQS